MKKRSVGSRIYLNLVGLALAAVGAVFATLMWKSYVRAGQVADWPVVPCSIMESRVESRRDDPDWPREMPQEYRFRVRYVYEWKGAQHESSLHKLRGSSWSSTPGKAEQLVSRFPEGAVSQCHVNPESPRQAVLEGESKAPGYSLWFPLLFVVGGLGIMIGAWRR